MKKKIEIEFDGVDSNGFSDNQLSELNRVLTRAIYDIHNFSNPRKVTVDGNLFWIRTSGSGDVKTDSKSETKYPVHHEEHIVMTTPSRMKK